MKNNFDLLVTKIDDAKSDDLEKNKDFVKEILANEIVSRYYYQKGRIQSSLNYDKDILEAITVLSDSTKYKQILSNIDCFFSCILTLKNKIEINRELIRLK